MPVARVEVIWPEADIVVAATVLGVVAPTVPLCGPTKPVLAVMVVPVIKPGVVPPIVPGAAKVVPLSVEAFKLATLVVEATENGAVPVTNVDVIWPVADMVVAATDPATVPPMAPGEAIVAPFKVAALTAALQLKPVEVV